ncbi:MAG: type II secretion system protein GspM [Myxococcota bacterium]|nr:type II secretion system protein GspM [Myxococcota bacterium]
MSDLLGRLQALFDGLSGRERILVGAVGVLLAVAIVMFGIIMPALDSAQAARSRLENAEQEYLAAKQLRTRYDEIHGRLAAVEGRIRGGPKGEIFTTLEDLAKKSAVKVDSMEPRTSPASEEYRETKVQVALRSVTLAQVVNYLHRIESAPQLLSVKSLRFRTRQDKPELLDVTFTVSSFEPVS